MATLQEVDVRETNLLFIPRSAMFKHKRTHRKPDPLMLLFILVSLAVMMTSAAQAAEPGLHTITLTDILDGEFMVAPVSRHGAGLHLSYLGNHTVYEEPKRNALSTQPTAASPTVVLSVRIPW
ncbi:MAG: hypothetical protein WBN95_02110 [Gammaproteobacteria bacterium]